MRAYATIERIGNATWTVITPDGRLPVPTGSAADFAAMLIDAAYAAGRASADSTWHPASAPPSDKPGPAGDTHGRE